jgi:hypothetical protein
MLLIIIAVPLLFFYSIGTVLGIAALVGGIAMGSAKDRCGNCGGELASRRSPVCYSCGANITFDVN